MSNDILIEGQETEEAVAEGGLVLDTTVITRRPESFAADEYALNVNSSKMTGSVNKQTGNPLSLVAEYMISASLDCYAGEDLIFALAATHQGRIKPATCRLNINASIMPEKQVSRAPYALIDPGVNRGGREKTLPLQYDGCSASESVTRISCKAQRAM